MLGIFERGKGKREKDSAVRVTEEFDRQNEVSDETPFDVGVLGEAHRKNETMAQPSGPSVTAELLLHPFNSSAQALWLCNRLRDDLGAEIMYVTGTSEGTVIKVTIRNPVPLVEFLTRLTEVAEAWREAPPQMEYSQAPSTLEDSEAQRGSTLVCVALKPATSPA